MLTKSIRNFRANFFVVFAALGFCALAFGCALQKNPELNKLTETVDPVDLPVGLSKYDYRANLSKKIRHKNDAVTPLEMVPLPKTSRLITTPLPPKIGGQKLISFSVTEDINLKDVLTELGRLANLDVDIDPTISGGVIINAKNRPFKEVIDRICNMGNVRYSYNNGVLYFQKDLPYVKSYTVDYLVDGTLWDEVQTVVESIVSGGEGNPKASYNKSAGIITIFANDKSQKEAEKYLKEIEKNASAQVLIEAKIVEVTLKEQYRTGINWNWGDNKTILSASNSPFSGENAKFLAFTPNRGSIFGKGLDFSMEALEEFGTVRAIASPRLNALNNQKATLNFLDKLVYFTLETETNQIASTSNTGNGLNQVITATMNEVDVGTQLTITPSINLKTKEITLNVLPKISVKNGDATDPTVLPPTEDGTPRPQNKVPIIQTRELNTTLKVLSGGTLVIGGLMKEDTTNNDKGVPFLSRIPLLGYLFRSTIRDSRVIETVIFIKATIIDSSSGSPKEDRNIQEKFDTNIRPFF